MKRCLALALTWLALLPAAAAELLIPGAGPPTQLLQALASAFNAGAAAMQVKVPPSTGISGALDAANSGSSPLARMPRRLSAAEQRSGLRQIVIAREAIVFATGADVTVDNLSRQQLGAIFTGKTTDWRELGGRPGPIRLFIRPEGENSLRVIRQQLPEFAGLRFSANSRLLHLDPEVIEQLQRFGWGLAWGSAGNLLAAKGLHLLALDGVAPSASALRSGQYPLHYEVVLIYKGAALSGVARAFVDFIASPTGQAVIDASGAVPLAPR